MSKLNELAGFGQAVWFDFIKRSFIESGELARLVENGVRGVTSNPSIFEKAIAGSGDYDGRIRTLAAEGRDVLEIYEALAVEDIVAAARILKPVFDATGGEDGYVSLEVSPRLSGDTEGTVKEALKLFRLLGQPNVMIKVPATPEGVPAIESLISQGVNVNATLIFSVGSYEAVAGAYVRGLEKLAGAGGDLSKVASVASIFVSRIDSAIDPLLAANGGGALMGRIAVDNSRLAYASFKEIFSGARWERLQKAGARVQRPLWASTGTKNPSYPDTLYVDTLIGPHTVNTLPPATLDAFMDHGVVSATVEDDVAGARERFLALPKFGVDIDSVMAKLLDEGVRSFSEAFDSLLASVAAKRARFAGRNPLETYGDFTQAVEGEIASARSERVAQRLWGRDHTLWSDSPAEIENRLGWLDVAERAGDCPRRVEALKNELLSEGIDKVLLIGMGGSSLAPEVFSRTFTGLGGLKLSIADTTVPGAILALGQVHDPASTVYVVSTKSGGTVETLSLFKHFYRVAADALGAAEAGRRFVVITDPGSALEKIGKSIGAREIFINDPNIGGRYAALSLVGLVPAGLVGVDLERVILRAKEAMSNASGEESAALRLGAALGALARAGRDKLTIISSKAIESFPDWIEQLVAESTGKRGRGVLPVVGEELKSPAAYGDDRVFAALVMEGDGSLDSGLAALEGAGHPVIRFTLRDAYDLGEHFFLWAFATATCCWSLGVTPFDQPDVESAKAAARQMLEHFKLTGEMPRPRPRAVEGEIEVHGGDAPFASAGQALPAYLGSVPEGGYVALQAYLGRTRAVDEALEKLREAVGKVARVPVTVGYGPRFLHSTGQLHKGDAGRGVFVQLTAADAVDLKIPDGFESMASSATFGAVKISQALGDAAALEQAGRRVIRFHMESGDPARLIDFLVESLKS